MRAGLHEALLHGAVLDHEDGLAVGVAHDGGGGEHESALGGREHHFEPGVHAGAQRLVGVGEGGADVDRAGGVVDPRADGGDRGGEGAVGVGVDAEGDGLADGEASQFLLGEGEVDVDRVDGLEGDEGVALGKELAGIDLHDAEAAGEGGGDVLLGDGDGELVDGGAGLGGGGLGGVELVRRVGVVGTQFAGALEVDLGQPGLGLEAAQLGLLAGGVEHDERIAGGDGGAGAGDHGADQAFEFRLHGDSLVTGEGADRFEGVGPGLHGGGGGADGGRRHDHGGVCGHGLADGEELVAEDRAENGEGDDGGEDGAFDHGSGERRGKEAVGASWSQRPSRARGACSWSGDAISVSVCRKTVSARSASSRPAAVRVMR